MRHRLCAYAAYSNRQTVRRCRYLGARFVGIWRISATGWVSPGASLSCVFGVRRFLPQSRFAARAGQLSAGERKSGRMLQSGWLLLFDLLSSKLAGIGDTLSVSRW